MFNSDFFRLMSFNSGFDMEKWFVNGASFLIDLLLGNKGLGRKSEFILNNKINTLCSTSITKKIGLGLYFLKTSLISMSWVLKDYPVVYHPMNFYFWLIWMKKELLFSSCLPFVHDKDDPRTKCCFEKDLIRKEWHNCWRLRRHHQRQFPIKLRRLFYFFVWDWLCWNDRQWTKEPKDGHWPEWLGFLTFLFKFFLNTLYNLI